MFKLFWKFLLIILTETALGTSYASAGETELARVRAELPDAARRLDETFTHARGSARSWSENPRSPGKSLLTEAHFAIDQDKEKVDIARYRPGTKPVKLSEIVYCFGEGTSYKLYRRAGDQFYQVKGIGATSSERKDYNRVFGMIVVAHRGVMGRRLTQLLEDPEFELMSAEAVERSGKKLMQVECASGPRAARNHFSLVLDPALGWAVRSCEYRSGGGTFGLWKLEIDYDATHQGVPLPRRVTLTDPSKVVDHWEFEDWEFVPTSVAEFSMAYYGLPDLVHARRPRNFLPYWLSGFAVILGLLAFVLRRLAARTLRPA